ncbi:uncharacterized protein LDX57_011720 [Aspergillus melleus]|uniref:uncharacterized protein n=1 Tax=Aspergillus melleus TaxID=138277 RepID=UPI001E8CC55B|nr:uncharacterized protein LDX57_011720 [Aspergillus melleus]KAH8434082.1 hypothetical protein LDX57_011720 [Aspergillus melleus]
MSFQNHHRPIAYSSPFIPPLSDIIGLEPEIDRRCAGLAPSQGRRCRNHTNQNGRSSAMMLLHQGTKDLRAGRSIDTLLAELGPHVLCWRHKDQASGLERIWRGKVRAYLDERGAVAAASSSTASRRSTASTRQARPDGSARRAEPARLEPLTIARGSARDNTSINDLTVLIDQALRINIDLRRRVEEARGELSVTAARSSPRQQENSRSSRSAVVNSTSARGSTSSGNTLRTSPEERVYITARIPSTGYGSSSEITRTVPRSMQVQGQAPVSRTRASASVSSRSQSQSQDTRSTTSDTAVRNSRSAGIQDRRDETPQVRRRKVEGECGVCLCELRVPKQDDDADDEEESDHSEDEDHDEGDNQDDNDDDDDEHQNDELAWCKARCGVNFHKPCIDQWLKVAGTPTCPACRSIWSRSMMNAEGSLSNFDITEWL